MAGNPPASTSGDAEAAARPVRGYAVDHREVQAGDTLVWCGHRLRVEAGGVALGMPIRELTLNVSEIASFASDDHCHAGMDGECAWSFCPQVRDGEPMRSGRHCPIDRREDEE